MFAKVLSKNYFIFLIFLLKAPFIWGFSHLRTDTYLQKAEDLQLHEDPKWINLGHYEKKFLGRYKSAFSGDFFISPEGKISPKMELQENIKAFFSDSHDSKKKYKRHPQCQFLARRNWLIKKLQIDALDILPCQERIDWKKNLGATKVMLIFASADLGNPASSFGHTFLKLVNPLNSENKDLLDYGINYAADADASEGLFYAVKGLFGLYNGRFTMLPYHQKIREYINLEGRDIWEYELNFTAEETDELVNHLLEIEISSAPYYFFSDNCSYQILFSLGVIRPDLRLHESFTKWVIPIDTVKRIGAVNDLITQTKFKPSLKTDFLNSLKQLNSKQKNSLSYVIKNLEINTSDSFNNKEHAEVLQTASKYLSVLAYEKNLDFSGEQHQLLLQRSRLGVIPNNSPAAPIKSPDQSHDSSAFYLDSGHNSKLGDNFIGLKFRASYHDLEQTDFGTSRLSQLILFKIEFRKYESQNSLKFEKLTLVDLINTNPVNTLSQNISWKVRIGLNQETKYDTEASFGYSFDLDSYSKSRLSFLFNTRAFNFTNEHFLKIGPEILFIHRPTDNLGLSVGTSYLFENNNSDYVSFKFKTNYSLTQNWDIQFAADDQKDFSLSILNNFIF